MDERFLKIYNKIEELGGECKLLDLTKNTDLSYGIVRKRVYEMEGMNIISGTMKRNTKFIKIINGPESQTVIKKCSLEELLKGAEFEEM